MALCQNPRMAARKTKLGRPPGKAEDRRTYALRVMANGKERHQIKTLAAFKRQTVSVYLREKGLAS